jgi:hypothetical protein
MPRKSAEIPGLNKNGSKLLRSGDYPHGLVVPPRQLLEKIAEEKTRLAEYFTPEFEKRTIDHWTLAYYFEGLLVAYKSVPQGVEVMAVGADEIAEYYRRTPPKQRQAVQLGQP